MGNLLMVLYGFISVILLPVFLITVFVNPKESIPLLCMMILYPLMGFIGGIIGAALYNLASKLIGGIALELDVEETPGHSNN
jgi:hypothetical protein